MDLRILVKHMLTPGEDWTILKFVGIQRAFDLAGGGHVFGSSTDEPPPLTSEEPPQETAQARKGKARGKKR